MTQRIAIETPNGTVYLGEECQVNCALLGWITGVITHVISDGSKTEVALRGDGSWFELKFVRPIPQKKMRQMKKIEVIQLVLKGAEFFRKDMKSDSVSFPTIYTNSDGGFSINCHYPEAYSHYTLPNDTKEYKLEVEE